MYDDLIKAGRDDVYPASYTNNASVLEGTTHFLHNISKFTMDHNGAFHKGYIHYYPEFGFQFAVQWNARYQKIYFTVPLPEFKQDCTTLISDYLLFPGNSTVRLFLKTTMTSKNDTSINYVSAKNILSPYPLSLLDIQSGPLISWQLTN